MSCATVAPASSTSSQTQTSFSAAEQAGGLRQQAQHDQAEAEIVGLGERMQAGQRIGKAQQTDRAGEEEEERRRRPPTTVKMSRSEAHRPLARRRRSAPGAALDEGDRGEGREQRQTAPRRPRRACRSRRRGAAGRRCRRCRAAAPPSSGRRRPGHAGCAPGRSPRQQDEARRASRNPVMAVLVVEQAPPRRRAGGDGLAHVEAVEVDRRPRRSRWATCPAPGWPRRRTRRAPPPAAGFR